MPRKKSSKAGAKRKDKPSGPAPDQKAELRATIGSSPRQTLLDFHAQGPSSPASTAGSTSPESSPSFGKSESPEAQLRVARVVKEEKAPSPVKRGRGVEEKEEEEEEKPPSPVKRERGVEEKEEEKPSSPVKRERGVEEKEEEEKAPSPVKRERGVEEEKEEEEEEEKAPSPVKRERGVEEEKEEKEEEEKPACPVKRERGVEEEKEEEEEKAPSPVKRERGVKKEDRPKEGPKSPLATLDDFFGCPGRPQAAPTARGRARRSKSAATRPPAELDAFRLDRHFPVVRRSSRRDEKILKEMSERELERRVLNNVEEGLKVVDFEEKGRGVVVSRRFDAGEFVVEYAGTLVTDAEAKALNEAYSAQPDLGCYMFWICHRGRRLCVDATAESGRFGRLINHSRGSANLRPKVLEFEGQPRLLLFASRQICPGEELLYDYGDRDKQSVSEFPWLKK